MRFLFLLFIITSCARLTIINEESKTFDGRYALMTTEKRPGFQVMILKDGKVIRNSSFGFADKEKKIQISESTQFRLASNSKAFTALAAFLLEQDGKIQRDRSIRNYLTELPEAFEKITVRNLIEHTSGLPDHGVLCELSGKNYLTNQSVLEWLKKNTILKFTPGSKFEYSNTGHIVLASLVEKVAKKPFPEFVKERIFTPLEMRDSFYITQNNDGLSPNQAKGYGNWPDLPLKKENTCNYTYGEDGIYTNMIDYAKWARYIQVMFPKFSATQDYVYGWSKFDKGYSHSGSWMGFRTQARFYIDKNAWILILGNFSDLPVKDIVIEAEKEI